jgi:hypothetical protein
VRDHFGPDIARRSWTVIDNELLAQALRQWLAD